MLSRIEPVLLVLADTVLGSSVWVGHYSLVCLQVTDHRASLTTSLSSVI